MSLSTPTATFHHDTYPYINPSNPSLALAVGSTVLITGGGQGIGVAFAEAFSAAGAANIVLLGRNLSTLEETKALVEKRPKNKSRVSTFAVDITDKMRVDEVFNDIASTIGNIDIYIANAGFMATPMRLAEASIQEFESALSINVIGPLIMAQAFLRHKGPNATIIAINTGAAHIYYMGPVPSYVASKAAAARMMDQLAFENPDVRVFNLHPGIIPTAMNEKSGMMDFANDTAELPAGFAVWLSSREADFLRGRFLWANWDVEQLIKMKENGDFEEQPELMQFNLVGFPFDHRTKGPGE